MSIDIHALASQLLENLANSIHDREAGDKHFCFSTAELHVVEKWLCEAFMFVEVQDLKAPRVEQRANTTTFLQGSNT